MNHEKPLRTLLKKVLQAGPPDQTQISAFSSMMAGVVPEDLWSEEMKTTQRATVMLWGETQRAYEDALRQLRADKTTEYLSDKELKDRLWRLVCEIAIKEDEFTHDQKLQGKICEFQQDICKPLENCEVLIRVEHLDAGSEVINLGDCTVSKFSRDQLAAWGLNPAIPELAKRLEEFAGATLIAVPESGNNPGLILDRAREKAAQRLRILQATLSRHRLLQDENLLFAISEAAAIRRLNDPGSATWGWRSKRRSVGLKWDATLTTALSQMHNELRAMGNAPKIRGVIDRAMHWIGEAIYEELPDKKVLALCSALEALLTSISDGRKGEAIAYRIMLLNSVLNQGFLDPSRILWIYELRSKVTHGSSLDEATLSDYYTLRMAATDTLVSVLRLVAQKNVTKQSQLIAVLEESEFTTPCLDWLQARADKGSQSILKALEEALGARQLRTG
ncbi:MAG: hypothetical protein PCFJNLEI_01163 [Verrucomicrobiae bacterium]|nr:hypothetical protein [Verrucomicrobiae bacterium]